MGLIASAEHLGRWFGDAGAELDLRPGGALSLRWTERRHSTGASRRWSRRAASPTGGCADRHPGRADAARQLDADRVHARRRGRRHARRRRRERLRRARRRAGRAARPRLPTDRLGARARRARHLRGGVEPDDERRRRRPRAAVFAALADPTRWHLSSHARGAGEATATTLAAGLPVSRPAVDQAPRRAGPRRPGDPSAGRARGPLPRRAGPPGRTARRIAASPPPGTPPGALKALAEAPQTD